ncbi:MAG: chemotaxis protein [Pirellulaceae bacterium]
MSSSTFVAAADTGILLEAGTNEVEVLAFHVGRQRFGVNVAKVREVLSIDTITAMPEGHPAVDGMVRVRNEVVTLVNLARYLYGVEEEVERNAGTMLLLEFNEHLLAFRVTDVDSIVRASWQQSCPIPDVMGIKAPVTSVLLLGRDLLPMLDFESIGASIGLQGHVRQDAGMPPADAVDHAPIIYAEDSKMISQMIFDALKEAGFLNVQGFPDGHDAWNHLLSVVAETSNPAELSQRVACLITDVEMPRCDGLSLTRRVREHNLLKDLPVVVFSSLVSRDNEKKGMQVGATAQVSKPKYKELIQTIEKILRSK